MRSEGWAFVSGALLGGMIVAEFALSYNNNAASTSARIQQMTDICFQVNSVPREFDWDNELICENGTTFNYKESL